MYCRQCGAEIADGLKFCTQCGAVTGQCCPRCGAKLEPGVKFCGECGAPLAGPAGYAPPARQAAPWPPPRQQMQPRQPPPRPARFLESWGRGWTLRVRGRASRGEYWWRLLGVLIECAVLTAILVPLSFEHSFRYDPAPLLLIAYAYYVIMTIPLTCLCIRRLHDQGLSGWFVLLWNIGPVGLIFSLMPGTPGPNKYGPVPGSEKPKAGGAAAGTGTQAHAGPIVRKPLVVPKPKTIHVPKPKSIVMTKSQCDAISGDAPEG